MIEYAWSLILFVVWCEVVRGDVVVVQQGSNNTVDIFIDRPAHFGGAVQAEGLRGLLVYAEPATACSPVLPPPNKTNPYGNWILLIRRNDCTFEHKVRIAQNASYDAAIVHNTDSNAVEPMSANSGVGIYIPSVFVGLDSGLTLKANYLWDSGFYIKITAEIPFNINTHLLLPFAIVVGVCFLIMVVFMVVKCVKDRRRQRRHRLPTSSLRKIPTAKFHKGDPYETCAICLEDYLEGDKLRILPCSHAYHCKCIDPWLTRSRRVCPVCKRKVFAHDEHFSDSESETDDEAAPLVRPAGNQTRGGTFTEQRENPFQRADRESRRTGLHESDAASETSTLSGDSEGAVGYGTPASSHRNDRRQSSSSDESGTISSMSPPATGLSINSSATDLTEAQPGSSADRSVEVTVHGPTASQKRDSPGKGGGDVVV